ncbi:DUF4136 domain-containing protein [Parasphingopyxis marina]|uniref:DUF4136 domain-containing protein n=1 Tax=Parasphingopyxis marina TaxID=2761622 RepID=A0A842HWP6_9SPHN|nr:DUF4136 domain-containing protein [Parasphingopyxis marina]MBC2777536.1 DUF4136 domain-containing protein [Parasphingopyxis marina]
MTIGKRIMVLATPLLLLAIAACTTPFRADVARFQQMPAPSGESFYVQSADPEKASGLEFATYANLVSAELSQFGYRPAATAEDATLVVTMDYSVDNGRDRVVTTPGYSRPYYWGYSPFYSPYYSRLRWRSPFYYGWYDPFFDSGFGRDDVRVYTLYTSELDLRISRTANGEPVFEGRARARSRDDNLTELVPNLIEAMFTGFPGNSGEEVRITVMPREEG